MADRSADMGAREPQKLLKIRVARVINLGWPLAYGEGTRDEALEALDALAALAAGVGVPPDEESGHDCRFSEQLVHLWHAGIPEVAYGSLARFMGLTEDEYAAWVECRSLAGVGEARPAEQRGHDYFGTFLQTMRESEPCESCTRLREQLDAAREALSDIDHIAMSRRVGGPGMDGSETFASPAFKQIRDRARAALGAGG